MLALLFTLQLLFADLAADLDARIAKPYDPGPYTRDTQIKSLEFETDIPGRLYGAVAWKIVDRSIEDVRAALTRPGGIFHALGAVKTQRDLVKVSESPSAVELKLAIKVPVVSDYRTQDRVWFKDDRLSWRQSAPDGQLEYNAGYMLFAEEGPKACRVLVFAVHVIKPENRVPWLGRGTAASFARKHYAGYIDALEAH